MALVTSEVVAVVSSEATSTMVVSICLADRYNGAIIPPHEFRM